MYFWHRLFRDHKWKITKEEKIGFYYPYYDMETIENQITSQCEICGDIKIKEV
jgi:hypothetical protein